MRKAFTSTLKSTAIYGLGNISAKLIGFVLIPLYTDKLSENEFGIFGILESLFLLLGFFFTLGLAYGVQAWFHDPEFEKDRGRRIFSLLLVQQLSWLPFLAFACIFPEWVSKKILGDAGRTELILVFLASVGFEVLAQMVQTLLRLYEKSFLFVAANVSKLIIHLSFSVWLIAFKGWKLEGIYYAQLISYVGYFILLLPFLVGTLRPGFDWKNTANFIRFGIPYVYGVTFVYFCNTASLYILKYFSGEGAVGIYALGQRISNISRMLVFNSIATAITPSILKLEENEESRKTIAKFLYHFTLLIAVVALLSSAAGWIILKVANREPGLDASVYVIPLLSFVVLLDFIRETGATGLLRIKRSRYFGRSLILAGSLLLAFSFAFAPSFGFLGIALAQILATSASALYLIRRSQHHYPVPYDWQRVLLVLGLSLVSLGLCGLGDYYTKDLVLNSGLKAGVVLAFAAAVWMMGFYNENEIRFLKDLFKRLRPGKKS